MNRLIHKAKLAYYSAPRYALVKAFGIGPFHITPTRYKQYCVDLIKYLNEKSNRDSILDIGCGIGDVLLAARFRERRGLDHKQGVLDALRFRAAISGKASTLSTGLYKLGDGPVGGAFDYIVLCNWIHNIDPQTLRSNFESLYRDNLRPGGELIFDAVTGPHYPHSHDPAFLSENMDASVSLVGEYAGGHVVGGGSRRLFALKKPMGASA